MKFRKLFFVSALMIFSFLAGYVLSSSESEINKEVIKYAERIIGIEFAEVERDSMIADLNEQLDSYNSVRNIPLDNSIPPSLFFNPLPVNFNLNEEQEEVRFSNYSYVKIPADKDELAYFSIGELAELIRTKQISSVELTKYFLERLKKYGPVLQSVITLTEERALKEAQQADQEIAAGVYKGLLHGIPYGVKDLLSTKDYKTTWGATPYKDQVINEDATVIKKLSESGAVLVAKLTMGALAWGDVWFGGKTKNPWDTTQGSSGSSAGSASSVSAGLVPFAIGTETWGSIVSPSTVCGVTGLRPTYGRVSRTGAMALSWSMDKIGPICRTAEDLAIVLNAIYGSDGKDQSLIDFPFNYSPEIDFSKLKIGYLKEDFDKEYDFHKNDSLTLSKLKELGAELIPINLSDLPVSDLSFILSAEAAAAFDKLTRTNKDDLLVRQNRNAWPNVFRAARFIPAVEYVNANRIRFELIQQMHKLMSGIDLYIAPSWEGDNLLLTNLTGHPCIVLPNGFSDNGTPTSITFIGRLFEEGKLIAFAKRYQDATDFHRNHPELPEIK
jgi:Asp-tRNA(Asn)/Glu-tRNA(Gln) amidotransferase A subunit family amidase